MHRQVSSKVMTPLLSHAWTAVESKQPFAKPLLHRVCCQRQGPVTGHAQPFTVDPFRLLGLKQLRNISTSQKLAADDPLKHSLTASGGLSDTHGESCAKAPQNAVDAFDKIDLRVGHVVSVENHPDADMLYVLSVDLGEPEPANNSKDTKPRTIVSRLVKHYSSDQLVGKSVVVFANMKPRKLRGIVSQGMLLAAGSLENDVLTVEVLEAPEGARPGDRVTTDSTEQQGNSQSAAGALGVCPFTKPLVKKQSIIDVFIQGLELNQRSAKYRGHNLVSENGGFISTKNLHSGSIG
ncbi:hypothetical protein IWW48_002551 [Coemansia sp. RSA 1200]|nr:hypothetical protein IWW48_002551 [Coemansia sp. RSA 1200]